jgi:hypothetical protein
LIREDTTFGSAWDNAISSVKAYISFIKDSVGIKHEEELVKTDEILAQKNSSISIRKRGEILSQSRMIARKLLMLHTGEEDHHKLESIIEALASKLYFHGHPINRVEARKELGLKVLENIPAELETIMWDLYVDFETEMQFREHYDPIGKLMAGVSPNAFNPGVYTEIGRREETVTWAMAHESPHF